MPKEARFVQVYVNAPNPASGPIPEDVKPYFEGPYFEWWNAEKVRCYNSMAAAICVQAEAAHLSTSLPAG